MTKTFDLIEHRENFIITVQNGKMGLVDNQGKPLTEFIYDYYSESEQNCRLNFCNKVIPMKYKDKWGVLDNKGKVIIDFKYDNIRCFWDYSYVELNKKQGVIDDKGNLIVEIKYDDIGIMEDEELIPVRIGNKFGYIDTTGIEVIKLTYDYLFYDGWNLILACKDSLTGFIDTNNNIVIDFKYELDTRMGFYNRDFSLAKLNGKYGVINRQGKTLIDFIYDDIGIDNNPITANIDNKQITLDI